MTKMGGKTYIKEDIACKVSAQTCSRPFTENISGDIFPVLEGDSLPVIIVYICVVIMSMLLC